MSGGTSVEGTGVRRDWRWWLTRVLIVLFGVPIVLGILGFLYETVASRSDWDRYPPPGELVDIGGYKLHIYCTGTPQSGLPTVILAAGGGNASPDWALVQPEVAQVTRVCSYDRAGWAWSDSGPRPRSSRVFATELYNLLRAANEDGPYIVVGHSLGSHTVRIFAGDHPDEIEGIVLVDPRLEELATHPFFAPTRSERQLELWELLARLGFFRAVGRNMLPAPYQEKMPDYPVEIMITPRYFEMSLLEDALASDREVLAADGFGDTPLIVIVHGDPAPIIYGPLQGEELEEAERMFEQAAKKLATLSTNSRYLVAEGSGHLVIIERPDLVIRAILSLVDNP